MPRSINVLNPARSDGRCGAQPKPTDALLSKLRPLALLPGRDGDPEAPSLKDGMFGEGGRACSDVSSRKV